MFDYNNSMSVSLREYLVLESERSNDVFMYTASDYPPVDIMYLAEV